MSETHQHVDLRVLEQVELLLRRRVDDPPEQDADDETDAIVLHLERPERPSSATHPAAHTVEQPLITRAPVTPLPRRR